MKIREVSIDAVKPYEHNPRQITDEAVEKVANSIKEFGFQQPIVVDAEYVVIAGHTRLLAAKKLGLETVPVVVADSLTPEQVKAYRLADNKTGEFSFWDEPALYEELQGLEDLGYDMEPFGFNTFLDDYEDGEAEEDDYDGSVPDETDIKRGDMFRLGDHILMCGDSTSESDVQMLIGGGVADMVLTDPPYNVAYEGKTKDALKIKNDSMDDSGFHSFLVSAFSLMEKVLKAGGSFYIWHADMEGINFRTAVQESGLILKQTLIWNKNCFTLGRQDYQWKHEPCLYGWKNGASHFWNSDRKQSTVIDWDKPNRNEDHPTMKPVGLMGYLIQNSSRKGEIVLDLFGGSGSTLIACEQLGRKCRMMELDPIYCQVIIDRWEALTGEKAEKIGA